MISVYYASHTPLLAGKTRAQVDFVTDSLTKQKFAEGFSGRWRRLDL